MVKATPTIYVCQKCGHQSRKWLGKCPDCGEWNSLVEERARQMPSGKDAGARSSGGFHMRQAQPVAYDAIESQDEARVSSGITEFDRVLGGGIVPGSLVLIGGDPGIGKCLAGSSRILDPTSGALLPITEWAHQRLPVVSLDNATHSLVVQPVAAFHDQGVHQVVEVTTRLGRTLRCTSSHPVLTANGWQPVGQQLPGTRIAAPRALPYFGDDAMAEHNVELIAYALCDGSAQSSILIDAAPVSLAALSPAAGCQSQTEANAACFMQSAGLRFSKANSNSVPGCVYRLPRHQLALFLKILFSCDGSVRLNEQGQPEVCYTTVSKQLAQDIQHLLLRFGFVAKLHTKDRRGNDRPRRAYQLQLVGAGEVGRFSSEIGMCGKATAQAQIALLPVPQKPFTHNTTIPRGAQFWKHLREATGGLSFENILATAGTDVRNCRHEPPLCGSTDVLAQAYPSAHLPATIQNEIYWDEIQSITPAGEERVYDLSVPPRSNFVANDLIVHNSTLLLEVADKLSEQNVKMLYVSGEESERQIKMRGERLGVEAKNLFLLPETNLEAIFDEIERMQPGAVIVDSIQTTFSSKIESAPGSVSQVREVAGQFLMLAKNRTIPVFLIGHVTKEGSIAGPKALEHIVDTVLYFEGERHHNHRIIRATKNRFGAANELGVFEMTGTGLVPVANPSEMFLQERPIGVAGSVVTACIEGTRPMLVEIQALVSGSKYGTGRRMAQGFDTNRVALLIAMLEKRVGLQLLADDVFVNVAGGLEIDEPAADLGVVASIASSFKNVAIDEHTAVFGEVGLTGEVRGAMQSGVRVREAQALGFKRIIMPASNTAGLERLLGVRAIGVRSVEEALEEMF